MSLTLQIPIALRQNATPPIIHPRVSLLVTGRTTHPGSLYISIIRGDLGFKTINLAHRACITKLRAQCYLLGTEGLTQDKMQDEAFLELNEL